MENHKKNSGKVGGDHLCNGDQEMQTIQDKVDLYSVVIATLEKQVQTRFGDINTRFDELTSRLEALGLHTWRKRKARVKDEARDQLATELIRANPCGQYGYYYSSDEEDLFQLMGGTSRNHKEEMNVFGDLPRG